MLKPITKARVLVADDDYAIRSLIIDQLASAQHEVMGVGDVEGVQTALTDWRPDVVVLDLNLPDGDGLELCRQLRAQGEDVAIIMVTARSGAVDRVLGLEFGADDYLAKPFEPRELVARVNNLARRAEPSSRIAKARLIRFEGWQLDRVQRRLVDVEGGLVLLSAAEYRLLSRFVDAPQQVLSREVLLPERSETVAFDRSLDIQISRLRQKLGTAANGSALILTVRNEGYLFTSEVHVA